MSENYFGAYCAQCNVWLRKSDHTLLYYPSPKLVQADLITDLDIPGVHFDRRHLFVPTEFGKEQHVKSETLPAGSAICPVIVEELNQRRFRKMVM